MTILKHVANLLIFDDIEKEKRKKVIYPTCFSSFSGKICKIICIFASRFSIKSGEMPTNRPKQNRWQRW